MNSTTFSNYIRNALIGDAEIVVSFEVTSLYMSIPKIDTLNITNDYFNKENGYTSRQVS